MTIIPMSLKIEFDWKKCIKWVAIGALGLFVLIFFVKVATFEDDYYRRMEGSERAEQVTIEDETLDETDITDEVLSEYTTPASYPKFLKISNLGIEKARILPVGVNARGELGTPVSIFDVGWYEASGTPGSGKTVVLDGHNGGPTKEGIFKKLPTLVRGDIIEITRGDDETFRYEVVENDIISLEAADEYMSLKALRSPESGRESVTLITCTGEWSQDKRTYLSRQFVRALLVKE